MSLISYGSSYITGMDSDSLAELIDTLDYDQNNPLFNTRNPSGALCFDYPANWDWKGYQDTTDSILTFYLNTLYHDADPNDDSKFYVLPAFVGLPHDSVPANSVTLDQEIYYDLVYDALIYASALSVSNADNPAEQAEEIKKGINQAASIFLFNVVTSPYDSVKEEYTACYDIAGLFDPDSGNPDDYVSHCMANYVKDHFENFNYQDVLDSNLDDAEIVSFLRDTADFYLERIEEIRESVRDSINGLERTLSGAFPTPMNVCQAAEDAANYTEQAIIDLQVPIAKPDAAGDAAVQLINNSAPRFNASLLSSGNIDCDNLPTPPPAIFDIINAVAEEASAIIEPAREDREAAEAIKNFLLGWRSSGPPIITTFSLMPDPPRSSELEFQVRVEDGDGGLRNFKIGITSNTTNPSIKPHLFFQQ